MLKKLWADEVGFVVSTELVLVATILVIALVVGLSEVRNAVMQELADVAASIGAIDQSYSFSGMTGHTSSVAGSMRDDANDFCDEVAAAGAQPAINPGNATTVAIADVGEE